MNAQIVKFGQPPVKPHYIALRCNRFSNAMACPLSFRTLNAYLWRLSFKLLSNKYFYDF